MFRLFYTFLFSFSIGAALFWGWMNFPEGRNWILDKIFINKFQTLEIRYNAEQIMEHHSRELLKDTEHTFLEPQLQFHPYLLMEVKYTHSSEKTNESIILWSLVDGEMVINAGSWEKTHGFNDCIQARADRNDFKIINALAFYGGAMDRDSLSKYLNVDNELLDLWIDKCRLKNLVVQNGNHVRLHLQNPKLHVHPETKLDQWLVTKPAKKERRIAKRYRSWQIIHIAKAAFGNDFAIRKTTEIFLPVYHIVIQNPDGSQRTTCWNALNGKPFSQMYYIE